MAGRELTYLDICKALEAHPTSPQMRPEIEGPDPAQINVSGQFDLAAVAFILSGIARGE